MKKLYVSKLKRTTAKNLLIDTAKECEKNRGEVGEN